jgi:ATP-binding cassette, subfamily B, multidrug efflux pump
LRDDKLFPNLATLKSILSLNKYLWKYKFRLLLGVVFIVISNLFSVVPAKVTSTTIDFVAQNISSYKSIKGSINEQSWLQDFSLKFLGFLALIVVFTLLRGVFMFFMRQTIIVMSRLIEYDMKKEIFDKLLNLPVKFYKQNNTGDLMARMSEDVSQVRMYIGPAIMYAVNLVVMFIVVVYAMLKVDVTLTIYVLTPLPILSYVVYKISSVINRQSAAIQKKIAELSTFSQETFSGIRVIQAYAKEENTFRKMQGLANEYRQLALKQVKTDSLFQPSITFLIGLSTIFTIYVGGIQAIDGKISTGNIAEFVIYVNMLTWPVTSLGWVSSLIQKASASQDRILFLMNQENENNTENTKAFKFNSSIEFRNVSLYFPYSNIYALKNISFKINKGESVGILGKTGSGKSSIIALLNRFYDPTEGEILIDNINIKDMDIESLRKNMGIVPQDVFLFSDSIKNNIGFSAKGYSAPMQKIEKAATFASISQNIMELPMAYDTIIGERGVTLSGGQKQRVSIARAYLSNPEIFIMDDSLSAVDTHTEDEILRNLADFQKERTSIIVGHRISSMKNVDKIIVLENGEVLETGNPTELLEKKGCFYDLTKIQMDENV